jgi:hypothetical protein
METMTQQTKANDIRSKYRDRIHPISELPPHTAEDIAYEKDSGAHDRRELRKLWKEERPEFNRLERLAHDLKVEKVIVTPDSPPGCGWHVHHPKSKQMGMQSREERTGMGIVNS